MAPKYPPKLVAQPSLGMDGEPPPVSVMDRKVEAYKEWRRRVEGGEIAGDMCPQFCFQAGQDKTPFRAWFPDWTEIQPCCKSIDQRTPEMRRKPLKLHDHCKSMLHVAALYGIEDVKEFRRYCRLLEKEREGKL